MKVAIIGTGAAAVSTAAMLDTLELSHLEITFFGLRSLGGSLAFGCELPERFTANSSDEVTALSPSGLGGAFAEFTTLNEFRAGVVPRSHYGKQLAGLTRRLLENDRLTISRVSEFIEVVQRASTGYRLTSRNGTWGSFDLVFLCRGRTEPVVSPACARIYGTDLHRNAYSEAPNVKVHSHGRYVVVGSRSSAIETALGLADQGGEVLMVSKSGKLPAVRLATPARYDLDAELQSMLIRRDIKSPVAFMGALRDTALTLGLTPFPETAHSDAVRELEVGLAAASAGASTWEELVVPLIRLLNSTGSSLTNRWTIANSVNVSRHIGAMSVPHAERLLHHLRSGRIHLDRATPDLAFSSTASKEGVRLSGWKNQWSTADQVISASGWAAPTQRSLGAKPQISLSPERGGSPPPIHPSNFTVGAEAGIFAIGAEAYNALPFTTAMTALFRQLHEVRDHIVKREFHSPTVRISG